MKKVFKLLFLMLAFLTGEAMAATCTSKASGNWDSSTTWNCTSGSTPGSGDTVILASPYTVSLNNNNRTVASLTINTGATLNDDGQDLTVTGSVAINGTYDGSGNDGNLIMTGNGQTLSGTGTVKDIKRIQIDANITIPAGSNLNLTLQSEIRVGDNAAATLTIDGTITGTAQTNGNRLIRVDNNNASNVIINGTINAPNSFVEVQAGGTVTNNGTVTLQYLDGNGDATANWTQGANSTLTLSQPAQGWNGTFDASATGNTVNFNGTATPFNPATYFNINVAAGQCPHPAGITVTGTSSCGAGGGGGTACIPTTVAGVPSPFIAGAGDLQLGNNGTVNGTPIVISGTTSLPVTGTTSASNAGTLPALTPTTFPAVGTGTLNTTGPVAAGSYGTINASGSPTVFSGGTYYIEKLKATGSIQLAAGTYYINKLDLSANLTVTGAVQLFIGDQIDLKNNGISLNDGGNAGNLQVNLYGGAEFDAGKNNISFTGLIYSPFASSQVQFDNNASITGAIITAGQIQFGNNATVNYDATVQGQISSLACPVSGPDHLEIDHTGTALTCQSPSITVKACANAACTTLYTGGASVTLSPGGAVVNTGATGSVTGSVTQATAGTATLGATATPAAANATTCLNTSTNTANCTMTFEDAGFVITVPNRTAGVNTNDVTIDALTKAPNSGICVAAFPAGSTQSVNLFTTYNNPATGTQAVTVSTGAVSTTAPGTAHNLTFNAAGRATTALSYPDVGQLTLSATGTALNGVAMASTGGTFVVRPHHFDLTGIRCTTADAANCGAGALAMPTSGDNPAAASAAGTSFIRAGHPFSVTVTARNAVNAITPNFGRETPAAENVRLNPVLVAPAGGNNPAIGGTFGAFGAAHPSGTPAGVAGVAHGIGFTWSEVGIITLTPGIADSDYLSAGDVTGTTSGNVGRFYAAQFALTGETIVNRTDMAACAIAGCGAYTYMGEQMNALFTLTAMTVGGATTSNYAGAFAYLDPTAFAALNMGAVDRTTNPAAHALLTGRISVIGMPAITCSTAPCFLAGVASVTAPFMMTRPVAPDGPYTVALGIDPADADGVTVPFDPAGIDISSAAAPLTNDRGSVGVTNLRFGRIKLSNAYGSELLPLAITATAQFWDGNRFTTSIDDDLTRFLDADVNIGGALLNGGSTAVSPNSVVFANGVGSFNLSAPGTGRTGRVSLTTSAPGYLPSTTGTATFGVYQGNNNFIYQRENY